MSPGCRRSKPGTGDARPVAIGSPFGLVGLRMDGILAGEEPAVGTLSDVVWVWAGLVYAPGTFKNPEFPLPGLRALGTSFREGD